MRKIRLGKDELICPRCGGDKDAILDDPICTFCGGKGRVKRSDLMKDFEAEMALDRANVQKARAAVGDIVRGVSSLDPELRHLMPEFLGQLLMPLFVPGKVLLENNFLCGIFDGYLQEHVAPYFPKMLDYIWGHQRKKQKGYGDADNYFTKLLKTKMVRVSIIEDVVTCSDDDQFIIIEDLVSGRLHIRLIVDDDKSDYPKEQYPKKLSLRFYQDREFIADYVEKWHMTNKGGVYGDTRDYEKGYVLSYIPTMINKKVEGNLYFYPKIAHIQFLLSNMVDQLKSEEKPMATYKMKPLKTVKAKSPFKKSRTLKPRKAVRTLKTIKAR